MNTIGIFLKTKRQYYTSIDIKTCRLNEYFKSKEHAERWINDDIEFRKNILEKKIKYKKEIKKWKLSKSKVIE